MVGQTPCCDENQLITPTIGLELGDRKHAVCVLGTDVEIIKERSIPNTRPSLDKLSERYHGALIVFEVGMHSPWTSRHFEGLGHRVLVAHPRKVRSTWQNDRKCDRRDGEMLACLTRCDEKRLSPVRDATEDSQRDPSGDSDKPLRISKAGDAYLHKLLISAAQDILGPFGPDCRLKRKGLELGELGGPGAKKKPVVAVARKLAVLRLTL
nr:transposase [Haloferula luteola]